MLDTVLAGVRDARPSWTVTRLDLADHRLERCTGCDACLKAACPLDAKDDFPAIHDALVQADAVVIASPVYFFNVPGILKDFIDRSRRMKMNANELKNKVFGAVVASGLRNGGGEIVSTLLVSWALSHGMLPATGLGNPVIENPMAITTLQGDGLKQFHAPAGPDEIGDKSAARLAARIVDVLSLRKEKT